jgi:hypothetical protein
MATSENIYFNENEQYSIPLEVTAETIRDFDIKRADIVPSKIGNKIVSAIMVPCTKAQYYAYMRPIWAEMQREERSRRCMVSNGRGGLKRCEGDCKKCDRLKNGNALSLDRFYEENNLEFNEPADDKSKIILALATLEDLITKLNSINPIYGSVIKMLYDGLSQRAIAAALGKPNSTTQDLIRKAKLEAQRIVSREDLYR